MILMNTIAQASYPSPASTGTSSATALDLLQSGGAIPLKQKWKISLNRDVHDVIQRGGDGIFAILLPNQVVELNGDGKTVSTYAVKMPLAVGQGKARLYVTAMDEYQDYMEQWNGEDYNESHIGFAPSPKVKYKLYAFDKNHNQEWVHEFAKENFQSGGDPAAPIEDSAGNVWVKANGKFYRISPDGKKADVLVDRYIYPHPVFPDRKGNVYTFWGEQMRYSPDLTLKTIGWHPDHFFLIGDQPYAISTSSHQLYKMNFDEGTRKEILHWGTDKSPLPPFIDNKGMIHLVLRSWEDGVKKALYVKVTPDGKVARRKELNLDLQYNAKPVVTPGGTLFMLGKDNALYALDERNRIHSAGLPFEPIGIFSGKGEGIIAALKGGNIVSYEAKTLSSLQQEKREEANNQDTLRNLQAFWNAGAYGAAPQ